VREFCRPSLGLTLEVPSLVPSIPVPVLYGVAYPLGRFGL
jgi:hypothetical protein